MKLLFSSLFLLIALNSLGQKKGQYEPIEHNNYLGFHFDDDFLFLGNRDEQYTGGVEIEYIRKSQKTKEKRNILNPFSSGDRYWNYTFGSYLYTPYNVSDSSIILNDRPFSSYIFGSLGYTAYSKNRQKRLSTTLYMGFMGSALPGRIQDSIHTIGDSPPAYGWGNRLAESEVFIPNLKINYQANIFKIGSLRNTIMRWIQLSSVFELNAGLFRNNLIGGFKVSSFNYKSKSSSTYAFNTSLLERNNSGKKKKLRLTTYFSPKIEFVFHNTTLQSLPWIYSPYTVDNYYINRHVVALECGFNLNYNHFHLSYVFQARSKEFKKYSSRWHTWAGITLGFSF
ncbi:MAG: DUF2219 family protein [Crocinitomix sp.]|nr:DUF2219 family protein [Crocinitomix sp.]